MLPALITIAVAVLTAVAIIAYRHPSAYEKIFPTLVGVVLGFWLLYVGFSTGWSAGWNAYFNALLADPKHAAGVFPNYEFPPAVWLWASGPVILIYLLILKELPRLGITSETRDNPTPKKQKSKGMQSFDPPDSN
jgi:hypothetical protein